MRTCARLRLRRPGLGDDESSREMMERGPAGQWKGLRLAINGQEDDVTSSGSQTHWWCSSQVLQKWDNKMEIPPFPLCECGFGSQCSPDSFMCGPSSGSSNSIRSWYRSPSQTANIRSVMMSIFCNDGYVKCVPMSQWMSHLCCSFSPMPQWNLKVWGWDRSAAQTFFSSSGREQ